MPVADPFETLGLPRRYEVDPADLEKRYRELQRALHPDKFAQAPAADRRAALSRAVTVNEAYRTLRDDLQRAAALLRLAGRAPVEGERADAELLMEVMELRESLADARRSADMPTVRKLAGRVGAMRDRARAEMSAAFDAERWDEAHRALCRLKYFARFLDEVAVIEEEALDGDTAAH